MPTPVGVQVEGLDELRRAVRAAGLVGVPKALAAANRDAAELIAIRAAPLAPVQTGAMRASVRALGSQRYGRVRAGSARVPYAAAIHWGRKRGNVGRPPRNRRSLNVIRARPFIYDTAQRMRREVAYQYERSINRLVIDAINGSKGGSG